MVLKPWFLIPYIFFFLTFRLLVQIGGKNRFFFYTKTQPCEKNIKKVKILIYMDMKDGVEK
jgi:hypothetical protein